MSDTKKDLSRVEYIHHEPTNIRGELREVLSGKDITPLEFEDKGVDAIIGTNEMASRDFFDEVQKRKPDGYLVGVGLGNVLTMLHCFPEEVTPKGIILTDIDPRVVAIGGLFLIALRTSKNVEEFEQSFFDTNSSSWAMVRDMAVTSINGQEILGDRLARVSKEDWDSIYKYVQRDFRESNEDREEKWEHRHEGTTIDVVGAVRAKYDVLKKLADDRNIAIVYADFTNSDFIAAVKELPGFGTSTNIVYSSNIVDHITNRGTYYDRALDFTDTLRQYEQTTKRPVFIDTLGRGLKYFLRARRSAPAFTPEDFRSKGMHIPGSQKPEGLLFADEQQAA